MMKKLPIGKSGPARIPVPVPAIVVIANAGQLAYVMLPIPRWVSNAAPAVPPATAPKPAPILMPGLAQSATLGVLMIPYDRFNRLDMMNKDDVRK